MIVRHLKKVGQDVETATGAVRQLLFGIETGKPYNLFSWPYKGIGFGGGEGGRGDFSSFFLVRKFTFRISKYNIRHFTE